MHTQRFLQHSSSCFVKCPDLDVLCNPVSISIFDSVKFVKAMCSERCLVVTVTLVRWMLSLSIDPSPLSLGPSLPAIFSYRVATKIFEDFGGALNKAFIIGQEPVSIVHYTRPGTCINHPLH